MRIMLGRCCRSMLGFAASNHTVATCFVYCVGDGLAQCVPILHSVSSRKGLASCVLVAYLSLRDPSLATSGRRARSSTAAPILFMPGCGYFCRLDCMKRYVLAMASNGSGKVWPEGDARLCCCCCCCSFHANVPGFLETSSLALVQLSPRSVPVLLESLLRLCLALT